MFFNKDGDKPKGKSKRGFVFTVIFILIYFLLITSIAPKKYNLTEGDIANVDIKAPRDTVDEKATEEKISEALAKVEEQYTLKAEVKIEAQENIKKLFTKISNINSTITDEKEKLTEAKKIEGFSLNEDELKIILALSSEEISEIQANMIKIMDLVYANNITEGNADNIASANRIVSDELNKKAISRELEGVLVKVATSQIKPNLFVDTEKTEEKRKEAEKSVQKEIIKQNQTIVKEGEPITARQLQILEDLGLLNNGLGKTYLYTYLILGLFVAVVLAMQYSYLLRDKKE